MLAPPIAVTANLLLWPVEEGFRRYYLMDARRTLRRFGPTVVAVAGSYGKTSTKELTATVLGARWSTLRPPGSVNTPMGISRVVREQLQPTHEVFVAELGDYVPGEIRFLCNLVEPRIGVFTTIGPEHLERFKTLERIVETKAELIDALPSDGVAVINQDDPLVRGLGDRAVARGLRVIRYGQAEPSAQLRARDIRTTADGLAFTVEASGHGQTEVRLGLLGRHNVMNFLAATGAALALGMSLPEIAQAARRVEPVEHRLQPIHGDGGILVIDDTYNSNPSGAAEALSVLRELPGGQKVLVTPGMIELAEREYEEHVRLGERAAAVCDQVILVGPERTRPIAEGLRAGGFPDDRLHVVASRDAATATLGKILTSGDVVLWENDLPDTYAEEPGAASPPPPLGVGERVGGKSPQAGEMRSLPSDMKSVQVDGLRIAYREDGPRDAPPVLVLHGWGADSQTVGSIQAVLRETHHTIAPDLAGFGLSDPPATPWGAAEYADSVRGLMEALGIERASIIGHSHGGRTAIVLAATYPRLVDRLVLVGSAGLRPKRGVGYYSRVYTYKAVRRLLQSMPLQGPIGEPLRRLFESKLGSMDFRATDRQASTMRGTLIRVVNEDWRHLLPRIQASTLLIWGDQDDQTPLSDGQLMEKLIPDAGLVVFPGAGHYAYADDLGRFARVVGHFLAVSSSVNSQSSDGLAPARSPEN
jgi:UDP-N-acetylmuramoyl-tripeptide--D-alanyl-D-alanine ligase